MKKTVVFLISTLLVSNLSYSQIGFQLNTEIDPAVEKSPAEKCIEKLDTGVEGFKKCTTCLAPEEFKRAIVMLNINARKEYIKSLTYEEKEKLFKSFSSDEWLIFYNQMDIEERKQLPQTALELEKLKPGILTKACNGAVATGKAAVVGIALVAGAGILIAGIAIGSSGQSSNSPTNAKQDSK